MKKRAQSQGGVRMHSYPRSNDHSTLHTVTASGWRVSNNHAMSSNNRATGNNGLMLRQNRNNMQQHSNTTGVGAKLMLIASDLRKNILPKLHEQINEIYKQRISNYLSLLAIHGEPNQSMTNKIFNASCASNGGNIDEDHLNELLDQIKKQ